MRDPRAFLAKKSSEGVLADQYVTLQQLYEKRLWHELTVEMLTFVKNDHFQQNGGLVELYENFLEDFEHRINLLSLAELIAVIVVEIQDSTQAIEFIEKAVEKVKSKPEAKILCQVGIGHLYLKQDKNDEAKKLIKDAQTALDKLDGVSTVHGRFYDLSSAFKAKICNFNEYYRDALRFLGCMDLKTLTAEDLKGRALRLAMAALLGDEIYNFGELLQHEVLEYLKTAEHSWLVDMLYAFNSGNIQRFQELRPHWKDVVDLAQKETELIQKISLLCLMEMTFKRKSTDRSLPFSFIQKEACLPDIGQVEHMVMKALSLGLIKGTIDEVEQVVHITWVQPRVLDKDQIKTMRNLLGLWGEKVKSSVYMVEEQAPELLVN